MDIPSPREKRPDLSRHFEDIILHALEKEPEERYQTMTEIETDLAALLCSESPVIATRRRRNTYTMVGVFVVATVCALLGGYFLMGAGDKAAMIALDAAPPPPPVIIKASPVREVVIETPKPLKATEIVIVSTPVADVFEGPIRVGPTPLTVKILKEKVYQLKTDGYQSVEISVNPLTYNRPIEVIFEKIPEVETTQLHNKRKRYKKRKKKDTLGKEILENPYK